MTNTPMTDQAKIAEYNRQLDERVSKVIGSRIAEIKDAVAEARILKGAHIDAQEYANDCEYLLSTINELKGEVERLTKARETAVKANVLFYQNSSAMITENHQLRFEVERLQQDRDKLIDGMRKIYKETICLGAQDIAYDTLSEIGVEIE